MRCGAARQFVNVAQEFNDGGVSSKLVVEGGVDISKEEAQTFRGKSSVILTTLTVTNKPNLATS